MSDIYSDSVHLQIKSPCKKRFPSPMNLISFTYPFLHRLVGSIWTAFADFGLETDLTGTGVCYGFSFIILTFVLTCQLFSPCINSISYRILSYYTSELTI